MRRDERVEVASETLERIILGLHLIRGRHVGPSD
jgi:hypothetical protein